MALYWVSWLALSNDKVSISGVSDPFTTFEKAMKEVLFREENTEGLVSIWIDLYEHGEKVATPVHKVFVDSMGNFRK